MDHGTIDRTSASQQLDRILNSEAFAGAERSRTLLRFLVEAAVEGRADTLKEYVLGAEALGRGDSFDPRTDAIVRAEASRLRQRLQAYYSSEGRSDSLVIHLPKGTYVPIFETRRAEQGTGTQQVPSDAVWYWKAATIGLAIALALVLWAPWRRTELPPRHNPVRLDVDLGTPDRFVGSEVGPDITISPDGKWLVFVALDLQGIPHLFKRRLDESDTVEIPGTAGARVPFFSPDSRWVAFGADGKLKKTLIEGGSPTTICEATGPLGGSWGEDGSIIAVLQSAGPLWQVPSEGGTPTVLDDFGNTVLGAWPQVLTGGKAVLFTSVSGGDKDNFNVEVYSLSNHQTTTLVHGGMYGRYTADGRLLYVNHGTLFAAPFDAKKLQVTGNAEAVVENVAYSTIFGYAQYDVSANGTLVYRRSSGNGSSTVERLDPAGAAGPLITKAGLYGYPRFSPDGQRLAISSTEGQQQDVWVAEWRRNKFTRWTFADRSYIAPVWTPDGKFVLVGAVPGGILWRPSGDAGEFLPLLETGKIEMPWSFTPDGKRLAFNEMNAETGIDIWTAPIDVTEGKMRIGKPEPFLKTKAFEVCPAFSPDGHWLAYGSDESGTWQVYVRAFPDNGSAVQVSTNGGRIPAWSRTGHYLLFRTDDQRLMAAQYRVEGKSFFAEPASLWSSRRLADTGVVANFDLAPDGQSVAGIFPTLRPGEQPTTNQVTFVLNFFDGLRR